MTRSRLATTVFVSFCIVLHVAYGLLCLGFGKDVIGSTALAGPLIAFHSVNLAGFMFLLVAFLAVISMFTNFPTNVICLLPQQIVLFLSAASGVASVFLGQFATGREQPRALIAAEQIYTVLLAVFHGLCIVVRGTLSARETAHVSENGAAPPYNITSQAVVITTTVMSGVTGPAGLAGPTGATGSTGSQGVRDE